MFRIIVVDDERYVRSSIKAKIRWDEHPLELCGEAANGYEALALIEEQTPDIVLCDMHMDQMDGVELMETVHKSNPHIRFIVISVHDSFEYTHSAISNQADDYILKPIEPDALNAALAKSIDALKREIDNKRTVEDLHKQASLGQKREATGFINRLLTDPLLNDEIVLTNVRSLGLDLTYNYYVVCVISVHDMQSLLRERFDNQIEAMEQKLKDNTAGMSNVLLTRNLNKIYEWILIIGLNELPDPTLVKDFTSTLVDKMFRDIPGRYSVGVGSAFEGYQGIRESYQQGAFACRFIQDGEAISTVKIFSELELNRQNYVAPSKYLNEMQLLSMAIHQNQPERIVSLLDDYFRKITGMTSVSMNHIIFCCYALLVFLEQKFEEDNISFYVYFDRSICSFEALFQYRSIREIHEKLETAFIEDAAAYAADIEMKQQPIAIRAMNYIQSNYEKKLTLESMSQLYYISKMHFERLFKAETGKTFGSYLTDYRMEKARDLVRGSDMPIKEISILVGYEDYRHFSKLYRKRFGKLPSEDKL